jgi:hypothetical protein
MDFKEFKKIILFAKKQGLKSLSMDGLHVEFGEDIQRAPILQAPKVSSAKEPLLRAPDPAPTLDDINKFIYAEGEEHA